METHSPFVPCLGTSRTLDIALSQKGARHLRGKEEQIKQNEARKLRDKQRKGTVDVYEETKKILVDNFIPNSNTIVERMKFLATEPRIGESDEAFLNRLSENSMFCGYDNGYRYEY